MFAIEERDAARDRLLEMAKADGRVVGAAVVGSLSVGSGDRWSDLDLTFAVSDDVQVDQVITDWTRQLVTDLDAVVLFDLPSGHTIYRVFLLPRCLQVDLSFTPAAWFRPRGPRFRLLFGRAGEVSSPDPPDPRGLFGWAVVYARAARGTSRGDDGGRQSTASTASEIGPWPWHASGATSRVPMAAATMIFRRPFWIPCGVRWCRR